MNRWLLSILLLVALVIGVLVALTQLPEMGQAEAGLLVTQVSGEAHLETAKGSTELLVSGQTRIGKDDVLTTGEDGEIVLSLGDELAITLDSSANVKVGRVTADGVEIELEGGRVKADIKPGGRSLDIGKGGKRFTANDAQFEVAVDGDLLAMQVSRGAVEAVGIRNVQEIRAGQRVNVLEGGGAWVSDIPADLLLDVDWPEQARTNQVHAVLVGVAEPGSMIQIKGVKKATSVRVGQDGRFNVPVELVEGVHSVEISALSMLGQTKAANWKVELDTTGPPIRGIIAPEP